MALDDDGARGIGPTKPRRVDPRRVQTYGLTPHDWLQRNQAEGERIPHEVAEEQVRTFQKDRRRRRLAQTNRKRKAFAGY